MSDFFTSVIGNELTLGDYALCMTASLLCGALIAFCTSRRIHPSCSFLLSVLLLPLTVQTVIMLVNGNIGTGVAIAGAFGLVRFRSAPGSARDIVTVFLSMAVGLATGTGYVYAAGLFSLISCVVILLWDIFFSRGGTKILRVTIPEDLDYVGMFDDLFEEYTVSRELLSAKTSNMGSLIKLKYRIRFKDDRMQKSFMDAVRCRNGNLEVGIFVTEEESGEQL